MIVCDPCISYIVRYIGRGMGVSRFVEFTGSICLTDERSTTEVADVKRARYYTWMAEPAND